MTKSHLFPLAALLGLLAMGGPAQAQEVTIKLGTLAPVGSPWHVLLKEAAEKIREASGGKVALKVFAGGTMGNEGDMVKKMRIGQLQGAALSTIGLHEITPEPLALDLPLLAQSTEEREHLLSKVGPELEKALLAKGYVVLNWSEIGQTRFFSTKARPTLADMQQAKIFVWEGDPASADAWKAGGFKTQVLSATDIISSLQTGMIDTVVYPPSYALALRVNDKAKYMHDLIWSSFTGAMVVKKDAWDKVPADLQPKILGIARDLGARTVKEGRRMEEEALTKMKSQGLQVVHITDVAAWQKAVEGTNNAVRGKVVPADIFDKTHQLIKSYRAGKK